MLAALSRNLKLYKSIIEDVIEGVRELFAEEGLEEQVLKDLKQLWETKVIQSKVTEGFFKHSHRSSQFTMQLPQNFHQVLQASAASLIIPTGRGFQPFTAVDLGASQIGATLALPSSVAYPIHVPAGVTLQTASGQLYKVNMPVMVAQASGDSSILHPVQHLFQPFVQPSVLQGNTASLAQVNASSAQAPAETLQPREGAVQQTKVFQPKVMEKNHLENSANITLVQQSPMEPTEQMESNLQSEKDICSDIEGIIQLDGTGDVSPKEEIPHRDRGENLFVGINESEDLKVLEDNEDNHEECDSVSTTESSSSGGDNEEVQIDAVEEDPLNSDDDVSEQDTPDLFDTDNVIVCQYDKIHRSKNKWKFFLKDGVMAIEGKEHVFAKAVGDAEW
ncbi:TFIIA-alpha and beta-like factor isoform X4 [Melanerpes formicivorus]|uniref:TFIIA-alpha and beta-like factor isoform X4 n=1 Tax=Melanerpes formicivorus TaxID=211600 RepID=UPI0035900C40